jgi:2-C-methyl-D-erythritol 4-phosphate cytidylyltransferase/2-C-methyl-D-erythritol 2,4-cyclodiphosphate synthase
VLLGRTAGYAREAGYRIGNVDGIVIAEAPRLAPHRVAIRIRLAEILGVEAGRVSVRGTSSNGLGFSGRGEGIAAIAVALLEEV